MVSRVFLPVVDVVCRSHGPDDRDNNEKQNRDQRADQIGSKLSSNRKPDTQKYKCESDGKCEILL